jgi:hypothetical protein
MTRLYVFPHMRWDHSKNLKMRGQTTAQAPHLKKKREGCREWDSCALGARGEGGCSQANAMIIL